MEAPLRRKQFDPMHWRMSFVFGLKVRLIPTMTVVLDILNSALVSFGKHEPTNTCEVRTVLPGNYCRP
jgi:hypothetical protein